MEGARIKGSPGGPLRGKETRGQIKKQPQKVFGLASDELRVALPRT